MSLASEPSMLQPAPQLEEIAWRSWPLRDWAPWSLLALVGLAGLAMLVEWIVGSIVPGLIAAALLAISMWQFWLPVRFEITSHGITHSVLGRDTLIRWPAIRSYEVRERGAMLYRTADTMPLDALRGLYLPWGRHREEVLDWLARYVS